MIIAYVLRTANLEVMRLPRFVYITSVNGPKASTAKGPIRNAFLTVRLCHVEGKPHPL